MASMRTEGSSGRASGPAGDDAHGINARLADAAARGETVEVILVLRGRVRAARGADRWRIREAGGRVLTFRAATVVAVTPVARPERSGRR
jgi:hypothetical protein